MIKNTISFTVIVVALPLSFFSFAMEQGNTSSPQLRLRASSTHSPRRGSLESPRGSRLSRSGNGSVVEIAVLAKTTLERVASKDKIAQLKKRNNIAPSVLPSTAAPESSLADEELLLQLSARSMLRSSKSPREKDEAELVYCDSPRTEELFKQKLKSTIPLVVHANNESDVAESKEWPGYGFVPGLKEYLLDVGQKSDTQEIMESEDSTSGSDSEAIVYWTGPFYAKDDLAD